MDTKKILQDWLSGIRFSHMVTVEPQPPLPYRQDEIVQRFRTIEFSLNKKYLFCSFPKWKWSDKFWWVGFKEGDGVCHYLHYHLLLYSPTKIYKDDRKNIIDDIQLGWLRQPSLISSDGRTRTIEPLHIEKIRNSISASMYCSKWIEQGKPDDSYFFVTPKQKPIAVAK